jgi:TonB family protein
MKRVYFVYLILSFSRMLFSQDLSENEATLPKFNGSSDIGQLRDYLQREFVYPPISVENGEQGTVVIKFLITNQGKIDSIEILNKVSSSIDKESIRCLKTTESKWTSAKLKDNNITISLIVPIYLKIAKSGKGEDYYINKGDKYYSKMDYKNSLSNYSEAIKLNPFNSGILEKKIDCEKKLNQTLDLERDLKLLNYISKK